MSSSVLSNGVVELEVIGLTTGAALAFQLAEAPELASVDTGVLSLAPAGLRISSFGHSVRLPNQHTSQNFLNKFLRN